MLRPVWLLIPVVPALIPSVFSEYGGRFSAAESRGVALIMALVLTALVGFLVVYIARASARRASRRAALNRRIPGSVVVSVGFLSQLYDTQIIANISARKITNLSADAQALTLWGGGRTPTPITSVPWSDVQSVESGTFETVSVRPFGADDRRYTAALYVAMFIDGAQVCLPFAVFRDKRANHAPLILDGYALREVVDRIADARGVLSHSARPRRDHA